ncbi:MAG TPA: cytochrome c biogenesis protein CcdA [Actinomycetota bacterium]|nr:cytochrome c biogenesis protein CcdA [Actinomycetota bacterium]
MIGELADAVGSWWGPALALAAGVVSFASPCVLPLVPGYLAMVTGAQGPEEGGRSSLLPVALFVLGFSLVFTVVFGFAATAVARALRSGVAQRVAGGVVLASGALMVAYALRARVPWLYREGRPLLARVHPGPAGALPLGMAFALGWTPCIGPVLGAILTLAASQGSTARALVLLAFYSLGLGIPFLLVGLGLQRLFGAFRFVARNYRWFAGVGGAALVAIGALLVSGAWVTLLNPVLRLVSRFTPAL